MGAGRALLQLGVGADVDDAGVWGAFAGQVFGYDLARQRWLLRSPPVLDDAVTRLLPGDDDDVTAALVVYERAFRPGVVFAFGVESGCIVVELAERSAWTAPPLEDLCRQLRTQLVPAVAALKSRFAPTPLCPTGDDGVLKKDGELWRCPGCHGAVLSPSLVLEQVLGARGLGPGDLKDSAGSGGRAQRCPLCRTQMAPCVVDDSVVDFCRGCGAVFADEDEIDALTNGRAAR